MEKRLIRKATLEDAKDLDSLLTKLINYERKFSSNVSENIEVKGFYKNILKRDNQAIFAASCEEKVIGFIYIYEKILDETFINKEAFIDAFFVEEEYRNKGIGKSLINEAIAWAKERNIKYIDIDVMSENIKTINIYNNIGFNEIKKGMRIKL